MRSRPIRSGLALASAALVAGLILTACGGADGGEGTVAAEGKLKVAASTNVWGSVLSAVGGDQVEVTSIVHDPSADPHSYETTATDAISVQGAKLTLANGGGYDDFFTKLTDQAPNVRKLVAFDISGKGKAGNEGVNEHVWYDLPTVSAVADQTAVQLGEIDPAAKQVFVDNATAFKKKLADLTNKIQQLSSAHHGEEVVATEPVAQYLVAAAGLVDATPKDFAEAVEQEVDVPVAAIDQMNQLINGKQAKAVINNAQTVTPVTKQVVAAADKAGVPVVAVTETLPAGVTDYIVWMGKEVDALVGALNP